ESNAVVIAHPAAVTLALLLLRARKAAPLASAVATLFEPVSEQGRRGMDELHEQTVNLLSFQQLPTGVFDSQVAFNMIGRYGPAAQQPLESSERRILNHFRRLVNERVPMPSLALVQAPVLHAHTFSIYVEFEKSISAGDFARVLAGEHVQIARSPEEQPSNVNVPEKTKFSCLSGAIRHMKMGSGYGRQWTIFAWRR